MIHLRIRRYDSDNWTSLSIDGGEEDDDVFRLIAGTICISPYQVQILNEDDEWEDLE